MTSSTHPRSGLGTCLRLAMALALGTGAVQVQAQTLSVTLCATAYTQNLPGPNNTQVAVPMWGYSAGACNAASPTSPGPQLVVPAGVTTLNVTLQNNLTVPTSLVIAGQRLPDGGAPVRATDVVGAACPEPASDAACRVRSFTSETPPGGTATYTFTNLRPGTYLYQSGTHPQVQVQMGLFGLTTLDGQATGVSQRQLTTNPNTIFDAEAVAVLSEIDPDQHNRIQSILGSPDVPTQQTWQTGGNSTFDYNPRYFLINGKPFDGAGATDLPVATFNGGFVALRMANAGLRSRSLMLNSGTWQLMTEDGNDYPAPREQYSALLPAGKTVDARLFVTVPGKLAVFDRRGGTDNGNADPLGGQVAQIVLSSGGPAPANVVDLAITKSDGLSSVFVGDTVTYTIVVTNNGPNPVTGAPVTDTVPANLGSATWTCAPAASCGAAAGAGNIATTVNLAVGAAATFTLRGTVIGAAGTLTNTATVAAPAGMQDRLPANNSATDIDTVLVRQADLSVTKTHSLGRVAAGGSLTYTIVAGSAASSNVTVNTTVTDTAPAGITFGSWTCVASGAGSSCPATGSGNLNAAVTLAPGGAATFTVNASVPITTASGTLTNLASIATPAGVIDPNTTNNTASDGGVVVAGLPTGVLDNFNRANAPTLSSANWSQPVLLGAAAIRVNSNQASNPTVLSGAAYWATGFGASQWAAMTLANATINGDALNLKSSAGSAAIPQNFIRVGLTTTGVVVSTTETSGLSTTFSTTITNASSTFVANQRLTASVDATGLVHVWKTSGASSVYVGSVQLPSSALWTSGSGRIGIQLPANARVDDFGGGTLP